MPRFFFHSNHPSENAVQDDEGFEFPNVIAAKREAVIYAGELLRGVGEKFWDTADFELTVTDENGLILFAMRVFGVDAPAIGQASQPSA